MLYEFYELKEAKKKNYIKSSDFEAIEEDLVYIIHKKVADKKVNHNLVVLSRLLNHDEDKQLRMMRKKII